MPGRYMEVQETTKIFQILGIQEPQTAFVLLFSSLLVLQLKEERREE